MPTESFFTQASLAYLASAGAGKDGKTYSMKPTDGTGDFTFSRGSNLSATRVGADGLIEKGRENLVLQSNQFDTTWTTSSASVTSGQSGYDGSSDAWLLSKSGASGRLFQNLSASGLLTFSVYMKANASTWGLIQIDGSPNDAYAYVDLSNGVFGSTSSHNIIENIENVGSGWYRVSLSINDNVDRVRVWPAETNSASGTSGSIYIQDAQLEVGLAATEYIESGASTGKAGLLEDEPRFDYSGGATCPSLLLEPSRTNLVSHSEYYGSYSFNDMSLSSNATTSPEGLQNAAEIIEGSNNTNHYFRIPNLSWTSGTDVVFSIYLKENTRRYARLRFDATGGNTRVWLDLRTGEITFIDATDSGVCTSSDVGNGWFRYEFKVTPSNTGTGSVQIFTQSVESVSGSLQTTYQGDGASGIYVWGAQVETGSYPTSYIPNHSGGSVTRGADFANVSSLPNTLSDNYSVFLEINRITNNEANNDDFMNFGSASSDRIRLLTYNNGRVRFRLYFNDGTNQSFFTDSGDWNQGNTIKFCITYNNGTLVIYANGVAIHTISQTLNNLVNVTSETQKIKQLLLFNSTLTPSEAITLTTI